MTHDAAAANARVFIVPPDSDPERDRATSEGRRVSVRRLCVLCTRNVNAEGDDGVVMQLVAELISSAIGDDGEISFARLVGGETIVAVSCGSHG